MHGGPDCWSIGALESVTSLLGNLRLRSAPDPVEYRDRLNSNSTGLLIRQRVAVLSYGFIKSAA